MDSGRYGGNGNHIIGGEQAGKRGRKRAASAWHDYGKESGDTTSNLSYVGTGAMLSEPFQVPTSELGSSKFGYCLFYNNEGVCPFGDNCFFIHDEEVETRESSARTVGLRSGGGYLDGVATGSVGRLAPPPPLASLPSLAPLPQTRTVSNATVMPLNSRKMVCAQWKQNGSCKYQSTCFFAHGEAEPQRYGGEPVHREANVSNQQLLGTNFALASRSSPTHVLAGSGSLAAHASGSGLMSGSMQRPALEWKVPIQVNQMYGDWMHDLELNFL